ncbi:nudix-type motif 9-like protein [Reticulomyxa filosa]|uniref:Nudix-type motif 9-like protein n=1 Tax=Reticulomyxa filosa TaxID=46433 RepID=X6MKC9_RETFI|nr:nudix-type motif 9-like protein [Reticulomyxa filosa]|eukprot:ETO14111.1 nudix-type motif 9-like protein [Reticulomyxa filosa]
MVESGDTVSNTLKKEFGEEALNSLDSNLTTEQKKSLESSLNYFFSHSQFSHLIFKGYVDDPRNTDNSWIETVAVNFHDDQGIYASRFPLHAGDDAASVTWMTVSDHLQLYASHKLFLHQVALFHHAHCECPRGTQHKKIKNKSLFSSKHIILSDKFFAEKDF